MNAAAITLISVIGTGLISTFLVFIRMIFGLINNLSDQLVGIRTEMHNGFREHSERLARIETKLDINPPAEAA
ncbi:MAG: hypothetical protein F4Y28_15905 [Acidimicrobiia bacterium]|nr:hypothetical protein [Acidimicrobiia bacterium]MYG59602.1 hypothetical protein [Acidimicrobiia bacterium]MYJ31016.1 hypothetical protein [Acidimicrobiia bacterium]